MIFLPELKNLSIAVHRPDQYQSWVDEYLSSLSFEQKIRVGEAELFHHQDTFDSNLFGIPFGKVETVIGENRDEIKKIVHQFFSEMPYEYCQFRLSQHFIDWIQIIQDQNTLFLDSTVELVYDLRNPLKSESALSPFVTDQITDQIKPQILEIAQSFCHGRFFTDPDMHKGFEAYHQWIENSLNHKAADQVYVYADQDKIHGLMTVKQSSLGELRGFKVPLVGKHGNSNQKGVSEVMLKHLVSLAVQQDLDFILIATQSTNIPALRGYISAGFEVYSSGVTLGWKKSRSI